MMRKAIDKFFSPEEGDKLVGSGSETKVGRDEMWLEVSSF